VSSEKYTNAHGSNLSFTENAYVAPSVAKMNSEALRRRADVRKCTERLELASLHACGVLDRVDLTRQA
jgi:hypothetical protein